MNRQMIEEAADNYAEMTSPSYANGDYANYAIADAFEKGALWRVNSVWHDVKEKPNGMFVILIDFGARLGAEEYSFGMTSEHLEGAIRWAYVSDLLPCGKEETK